MRRTRVARAVVVAVVLALTVAGCTGVPGSSAPQVVRTIGLGEAPPPSAPAPPAGASRRSIVNGFIDAMKTSPDRLDAARAYLDGDAAQNWSDNTVTIVRDGTLVVGSENGTDNTVPVRFQEIGSLSADGVYSPVLTGDGANAVAAATYSLTRSSAGQWRISTPVPRGLFLTASEFSALYSPKPLYFQDSSLSRLVPDLRYSALTEPSVESFLLAQLIAGPRPELTNAVAPFQVTASGSQRASVTPGSPTVVQIPGANALDGPSRIRLAAQLAFTLRPSSFQSQLQLRDGNQIITVPDVGDTFDYTDFGELGPVSESGSTTLTYVRDGAVVDAAGKAVYGPLGTGQYALDTAVYDGDGGRTRVAGTTGPAGQRRLLLGDVGKLVDARVPTGPLSAPAWAPIGTNGDSDEVWVARGSQLLRVVPGKDPVPVTATAGNTSLGGTITSLAFSPEGTRLALVITTSDGASSQVWIGSVYRNGPDVRLDAVEPITPRGITVSDVGWQNETVLAGVGTAAGYSPGVYFDVAVDGSRFTPSSPDGLPERPVTIAVSPRLGQQWVAVGTGSVWTRPSVGSTWAAPSDSASQEGTAPSFSS